MATIKSHLVLQDGMSRSLRAITNTMSTMINNMESVKQMGQSAFETSQINEMRDCIKESNSDLDQMENNYRAIASASGTAVSEQVSFNQKINDGISSADGLLKKVTSIAAAYMGFQKVKGLVTDSLDAANTQLTAEVQLGTVMGNMGMSNYYDDVISKAKAVQASGMYGDETMIAGAAELSTYFEDGKAVLSMMDTLTNYAAGMSGGAALDSTAMTDYATNIGKIMTGSFDAMTKKGFEFTDAQKAIIKGTATEQQIVHELGKEYLGLSHDMQAAATINNIIDESWAGLYDTLSNTPQGEMSQFNNLLSDSKELLGYYVYPAVKDIIDYVMNNKDDINQFVENLGKTLNFVVTVLGWILQGAMNAYNYIADNWSQIGPLILTVAGTLGALKLAIDAVKTAQWLLNIAMDANPIGIIIIALIALLYILYTVSDEIAKARTDVESALGFISGCFMSFVAFWVNLFIDFRNVIVDIIVGIQNSIAVFANNLAGIFDSPLDYNIRRFYNFADCVLGILQSLASAIDATFGFNTANAVQSWRDGLKNLVFDKWGVKEAPQIIQKWTADHWDNWSYDEAWKSGVTWGDSVTREINGFFSGLEGTITNAEDLFKGKESASNNDYNENPYEDQLNNIGGNTSSIAENLSKTTEELKYLRDIAEREAINRFTTAEVKIDMSGMTNKIDGEQDIDGIISVFTNKFVEALETASEGVHI